MAALPADHSSFYRCPTGKRVFYKERHASRAIANADKRGELGPLRHYLCPTCGLDRLSLADLHHLAVEALAALSSSGGEEQRLRAELRATDDWDRDVLRWRSFLMPSNGSYRKKR